ncbi:ubiquitin carboxyl-terminal hydrolase 14 [Paragonimus westermani]|uniref:Ubiquitin carboxyl-terminal hydrolase n=1 Tax=Paragonimus westermani TaxID=34504 RepID=A0A5J4NN06_9TREM|nr:ubiquitin carboxyl-terminal hydrolase 14 [Paragonimus westermani]
MYVIDRIQMHCVQGSTIMLMGTADELPNVELVDNSSEDSRPTEEKTVQLPFGLVNLGNTCYMNATIQLLYSVPEIRASLKVSVQPQTSPGMSSPEALVTSLRLLFNSMEKAEQSVIPAVFVTCLRSVCPQFATRLPGDADNKDTQPTGGILSMVGGRFAQQDANECWVEIVHALQRISVDPRAVSNLPEMLKTPSNAPWNPVDRYFTGRLTCKLTCTEAEEQPTETEETFTQLSCFINQDVKFLHTGIRNGFEGTVTKHSTTLGRDAVYKKTSVITRLPGYLSVHFVRFFYKEDKQLNAKILKDVKFPMELDLFSFCSESLQKELIPIRELMRRHEDRMVHEAAKPGKSVASAPNPVTHPELFEPYSLPRDPGSNNSGYYELIGVLSHQGRTSSSGHYVAWVKVNDTWIKFDDDVVTPVALEDILRLSGGGDWHCAYILLYGPKRLLKDASEPVTATNGAPVATGPAVDAGFTNASKDDRHAT